MLSVQRLELHRGGTHLLRIGALRVPAPGLLFLVGPGGAGKSSLLMAMAGATGYGAPAWSGSIELDGSPIGALNGARVYLPQHAQLDPSSTIEGALAAQFGTPSAQLCRELERLGLSTAAFTPSLPSAALPRSSSRLLAVLAGLMPMAELYLVDEPTADLEAEGIALVRRRLAELARHACVIVATHNRQDCLALGGRTALIAGSGVQECADSAQFFTAPSTPAGCNYVENGNCSLPRQRPSHMADGFWWAVPGLLCGMSRPGLMYSAAQQFERLRAQGVRHLVCLEERCSDPARSTRDFDITHHHYAIADMAAPSFAQAVDLCRALEPGIRANQGVAMHCRGGLGRTGTGLATLLIWFGDRSDEAIAKIRRAQPLAIQTLAQVRFLHDFANRISGWHASATPTEGEF